MSASHRKIPPDCAIVIFGANGDLTKRLIVPALYNLARTGMLPEKMALIGVDHNDKTSAQWRDGLRDFLVDALAKSGAVIDEALWGQVARNMIFLRGDFEKTATYQALGDLLAKTDQEQALGGNVLFYLAVADRFFATIAAKLGETGLVAQA